MNTCKRMMLFCAFCFTANVSAKSPEVDIDTWLGYAIPKFADETGSICSTFKSPGNNCQLGGVAVGMDVWLRQWSSISLGLGLSYLPVSAGSIQISDQQLMNFGQSLFPVILQSRYELGRFFVALGVGYAIPLETPKLFPDTPITYSRSPLIPFETALGVDLPITGSVSFLVVAKVYSIMATKNGSTFHEFVPSIAVRARLGYVKGE